MTFLNVPPDILGPCVYEERDERNCFCLDEQLIFVKFHNLITMNRSSGW